MNKSTVYTSTEKKSTEDHQLSDLRKKLLIQNLEEKLGPPAHSSDISVGNRFLGPEFARDYLNHLKSGGELDIEGFFKYRWNHSTQKIDTVSLKSPA